MNIAFQAHIATDDEEDSEDGSIAGTSCKDNYHIGERIVQCVVVFL